MALRAALLLACLALVLPGAARSNLPGDGDSPRTSFGALARRGLALYCGGRHGRYVALTFDDGPSRYTPRVLRILARARARATFFVLGNRVAGWPGLVGREELLGAVGNHTWDHAFLSRLGRSKVDHELLWTQAAVVRATGLRPLLFRPPYGIGTRASTAAARALGLVDVRWSVDSGDSRPGATPTSVLRTILAELHPGAIVLLHDIHPWTVAALPSILRALKRRGLEPVTIPELVALDPPSRAQLFPLRPSGRCP